MQVSAVGWRWWQAATKPRGHLSSRLMGLCKKVPRRGNSPGDCFQPQPPEISRGGGWQGREAKAPTRSKGNVATLRVFTES